MFKTNFKGYYSNRLRKIPNASVLKRTALCPQNKLRIEYISTRVNDVGAWQYDVLYVGVVKEKAADFDHRLCLPSGALLNLVHRLHFTIE